MRARLTEKERYLAEGYYFHRGPGHDRQRAIVAYQALLDRGDTAYAANNLAYAYISMRDFAKAETLFRMSLSANPDNTIPLPNLLNAAIDEGKQSVVDSLLPVEQRRLPNSQYYPYHLAVVAANAGDYERAERILDSAHSANSSLDTRFLISFELSEVLATRGRLASRNGVPSVVRRGNGTR